MAVRMASVSENREVAHYGNFETNIAISRATITLGDITLSTPISRKYLGIKLSANLTWNDHVTTVIKKATRLIAIMRKLRNSLTKKNALTTFYKLYFRPILEYASTTWCNLTQTHSGRLERC